MCSRKRFALWGAGLWIALAAAGVAFAEEETLRSLVGRLRQAVETQSDEVAPLLEQADAATRNLDLLVPGALDLRIHVLRSELLAQDEARGPLRAASLAEALLAVERAARAADRPGLVGFALAYRAELYARAGREADAETLLERALATPERPETWRALLYGHGLRAGWALARGDAALALDVRRRALELLERHRARLDAGEFLTLARPALEGLAESLLEVRRGVQDETRRAGLLRELLDTTETLRVAELREYFGDACLLDLEPTTPELLPDTLLLYPLLLRDRVELIVGRAGRLDHLATSVSRDALESAARGLRRALQDPTTPRYRAAAAELYEALIRPLGAAAFPTGTTLVYVPTGALRSVPLAALYDARAERFLAEQVPIATLPSLRVLPARPIDPERVAMLPAGLTRAVDGLAPLPAVARELRAAGAHFDAEPRVNAAFSTTGFEAAFEETPYDIVHVASHGRFEADSGESYVTTHDGRLTLPDFAELLSRTRHRSRRPLALLVLSACETALGDERAVLGLAGVAVQSGARSAVATLWRVHDEATATLFETFYAELAGGAPRAVALQRAQRALLGDPRYRHPIFWSAFLMVSGWQ